MHTEQVYRWLAGKPVQPEHRARVAALMSVFIIADKLTPEQALDYWRTRRPSFFFEANDALVEPDGQRESSGQKRRDPFRG